MKANKNKNTKFNYPPLNRPRLPSREEVEQFIDYLGAAKIFAKNPSKLLPCFLVVYDIDEFGHKIMMITETDEQGFPEDTTIAEGYTEGDEDKWRLIGKGKNKRVKLQPVNFLSINSYLPQLKDFGNLKQK